MGFCKERTKGRTSSEPFVGVGFWRLGVYTDYGAEVSGASDEWGADSTYLLRKEEDLLVCNIDVKQTAFLFRCCRMHARDVVLGMWCRKLD